MKNKLFLISLTFILISGYGFAQKKKDAQTFISGDVTISKYHDRDQLETLNKGDLLDLYIERIEIIVKILPNIAFATNSNVTMQTLGIPDTKDHRKALKENNEAADKYFEDTIEYQKKILPYSDKSNLIAAILFYEQTLKALYTFNEFERM